ncbi:leukotriene A-4 hydrolase-like isoform X4 [Temnothorax nylanderi]|uniref:leukotriene A-4 hydrolase-like isoform X4 n=1 Tax=Temnothorax nylanderi TaxID=102681 RepID=UPI003A8B6E28
MDRPPAGDIPYSYSRPDLVAVTHTRLYLSVKFDRQVLEGKVILTVEKKAWTCNELVLDTYGLTISEVQSFPGGAPLIYNKNDNDENFGSKLTIILPKKLKVINIYKIQIEYKTDPNSPALYWLKREQTSDGEHPLLISNSKLTYARAIFPCQDTPSNRITFYSEITVPRGLNVMMHGTKSMLVGDDQVKYKFFAGDRQNITMAPYEIYIIVGSLTITEVASIDGNLICNLWTEQKYLLQGTMAINKIKAMLSNIKQSYDFTGRFNVCVLPPNVPEFDMQYPYVTFVSSTLLDGHYFMIDKIVQNIIESWIGRTVAIDNFKHLWLIKGLSTFIYRNPINNIIDDEDIRKFLKIKGINNLLKMPELQTDSLVPDLTGKLPMNIIKYVSEKGCVFLNYLQDILGGPTDFRRFLVENLFPLCLTYEFLTTDHFKTFLYQCFSREHQRLNSVEWEGWFNELRFPTFYNNSMTIRTIRNDWHLKADRWVEQEEAGYDLIQEVRNANDFVKIEFLTYLLALPAVPRDKLKALRAKLQMLGYALLDDQEICEIRFLWLRLCIKSRDLKFQIDALKFASEYCMPKYACPIFRDLYEWEVTRKLARSWFMDPEKRSKMLPETINELESILEI